MDGFETPEIQKGEPKKAQSYFTCDYCQKQFSSKSGLTQHLKVHTDQKHFHCKLCNYSSHQNSHLQVHIRRHLQEKPFKCEKINCKAIFVTSSDLKHHQNVHNKNNKQFSCSTCPFKTHAEIYLKIHVKNMHSDSNKHFCNLCEYSTAEKGNLTVHIRRHLKERPFKCPENNCQAAFSSSTEIKLHQLIHNKNKVKGFPCVRCPYKTHTKRLLKTHVKTIHSESRPFKCSHENCDYSAKLKTSLNRHMEIHSLEKSQVCPHPNCGFRTKTSQNLKQHLKTHSTGEKMYKCHFCQYSSHRCDHLILHVRHHTGETPFACKICLFKTTSKSNLNQHGKTHFPI